LYNKVVLTSTSLNSIVLKKYEPKAILVLDPNIFDTLKVTETEKNTISFNGHLESEWIKSYNVIASYKHEFPVDSTITITAHWDSSNGVGAGDNASGTAALIELAKFFSKKLSELKYNLIFIATGAEEPGLVGSMSYVLNHSEDLDKCLFNMNIDDISSLKPYIETSNLGLIRTRSDTSQTLTVISYNKSKGNLITSFIEVWGNNHENI
jgi:Zn-dependent M28 family amino/carboxypeptidase